VQLDPVNHEAMVDIDGETLARSPGMEDVTGADLRDAALFHEREFGTCIPQRDAPGNVSYG
jgi:hypothetical protein